MITNEMRWSGAALKLNENKGFWRGGDHMRGHMWAHAHMKRPARGSDVRAQEAPMRTPRSLFTFICSLRPVLQPVGGEQTHPGPPTCGQDTARQQPIMPAHTTHSCVHERGHKANTHTRTVCPSSTQPAQLVLLFWYSICKGHDGSRKPPASKSQQQHTQLLPGRLPPEP